LSRPAYLSVNDGERICAQKKSNSLAKLSKNKQDKLPGKREFKETIKI